MPWADRPEMCCLQASITGCPACCDMDDASKPVQLLLNRHSQCCVSKGTVLLHAALLPSFTCPLFDPCAVPVGASAGGWHIWGTHTFTLCQLMHHPHSKRKGLLHIRR